MRATRHATRRSSAPRGGPATEARRGSRFWGILLAASLAGCSLNHRGTELAAVVAYAVGQSIVENGPPCPVDCPTGRLCNKKTGFCERVPCDNRCLMNEQCVQDARGERCEPLPETDGGTREAAADVAPR